MKAGISRDLYDGDMKLTRTQLETLKSGTKNAAIDANLWTNNQVFYEFGESFDTQHHDEVRKSLKILEDHTCLNFIENTVATNRIVIENEDECFSYFGMLGGTQFLSLGNDCVTPATIMHEFMHALGFVHTQSRSDRDGYVTIDLSVVNENFTDNFDKVASINYTPYEYGSVMHYGASTFAEPNETTTSIYAKNSEYQMTMGNELVTITDFDMINILYECHDNCPAKSSAKCAHKGYPNPNNCSKCVCPDGYGGDLCDQRPNDHCGKQLWATDKWQESSYNFSYSGDYYYKLCTSWITTKRHFEIQVQLISTNNYCDNGCIYQAIEFKTYDEKLTNPRNCCEKYIKKIYTSSLNPTPVIMYNRKDMDFATFRFRYRRVPKRTTTTTTTSTEAITSLETATTETTEPTTYE